MGIDGQRMCQLRSVHQHDAKPNVHIHCQKEYVRSFTNDRTKHTIQQITRTM